jgi:ABC-2 type transport system permease protein
MTIASPFPAGTFTPAPGRGSLPRMVLAQTRTETMLTLRNGEQVLLTLLIPIALLIGLTFMKVLPVGEGHRIDLVTPRILALAVMSTAFTGQAIALGFDRRYGVLKRLAATALPIWLLVVGRLLSALSVVAIQLVILGGIALLLGWSPAAAGLAWALLLILLGTLTFGALGVLLGGALRAEIVLALANIIWFILLLVGGIALTPETLPGALGEAVRLLPSGALAESLRTTLTTGAFPGWTPILVLTVWAAAASALATRTTKLT